jgi:aspartate/methionine/tyrosine aminotransferase
MWPCPITVPHPLRARAPRIAPEQLQALYQERALTLAGALRRECGDRVVVNVPAGGMFLWVEVPIVEDTEELVEDMVGCKVCPVDTTACDACLQWL